METITATKQSEKFSRWSFSQLDLNCLTLVIKGMWVFDYTLDEEQLTTSLAELLSYYPHLAGRVKDHKEITLNNKGVAYKTVSQKDTATEDIQQIKNPLDHFNEGLDIKDFSKGNASPLSIQLTQLSNGSVLNIHCAHVCMDGHAFFDMVENWSRLYQKQAIIPPTLTLSSKVLEEIPSKEEAQKQVQQKQWKSVGIGSLFRFFWQKVTGVQKHVTAPIFISNTYIQELKNSLENSSGQRYSTHTVLSALFTKLCYKLNDFKKSTACSQISVIDLRGQLEGIEPSYVGNAVMNVVTPEFSPDRRLDEIAEIIDHSVQSMLKDSKTLREHVQLNIATARYKLPYTPFDLKAMNASRPTCFYVNNLLKFPIYDLDFGKGKPILVLPNDLPDAIKFWPSRPEQSGVNIYLRGYLAKRYNKIASQEEWLDQFFKHITHDNLTITK